MKRFVNHLLGLNNLRKFCGNAAVFGRFREKYRLKILDKPKSGRVLVLAPHPDDDVFGCGGSLAMHVAQGDKVKVVYFAGNVVDKFQISNSKFLIKEGGTVDKRKNNQVYSSNKVRSSQPSVSNNIDVVRSEEAENAAKILKVADIEFWGLTDNKFTADKKNVERLKKVIKEYRPTIIYCPSFTDTNPDHYEVARMLYSVIARRRRSLNSSRQAPQYRTIDCHGRRGDLAMTRILLYEVWTPTFVNRLIKIDTVFKQKKAAILCHQSQLKDRSYFNAIIGLNQYRAGMFNAGKYAEGFWEMEDKLYVELFEKYQLNF